MFANSSRARCRTSLAGQSAEAAVLRAKPAGVATAFTLIELLVVIAIIAVLAALAVPAVARALDNGKRAACVSNLSVLGKAFQLYTADQGQFPQKGQQPQDWLYDLKPYLGGKTSVTLCPVKHTVGGMVKEFRSTLDTNLVTNYGISYWVLEGIATGGGGVTGKKLPRPFNIPHPSKVAVLIDANSNWIKDSQTDRVSYVHGDRANVLYLDGRVISAKSTDLLDGSGKLSCMGEPLP